MAATPVHSPPRRGCIMTRSLYLKANGEMPCWDDVGEATILRKLDPEALAAGAEHNLVGFDRLVEIRTAFAQGRTPFPGLCERCAVREHGSFVGDGVPTSLDVLHVEPSYLCRLSCPLCIPSKLRISLKGAPYQLSPEMYGAFLRQLRRENVSRIELVHFEGRGDPVSNPRLGELVALTKDHYPTAHTLITTHGNIPYRPWILECGLDALRLSVDGAFPESYLKYRVGGKLETVLQLMRDVRDEKLRTDRRLAVEWKYILFEWNDSDDELREAARLAHELHVSLRFCRTHSEGRSQRFPDAASVAAMIADIAPGTSADLTFQLKGEDDVAGVDVVRAEHVRAQFTFAAERRAAGDAAGALRSISDGVALDLGARGIDVAPFRDDADLIARAPELLDMLTLAITAASLGSYLAASAGSALVPAALKRYLALAPHAGDRRRVEVDISLREAYAADRAGLPDVADQHLARVFGGVAQGSAWLDDVVASVLDMNDTAAISALANILEGRDRLDQAVLLFERYLQLAPHAADYEGVTAMVERIRRQLLLRLAFARQQA
jgi:molybdenum cofactor biosynthesis enzyme MoaA